jgi:tetratricopeptide (TPR) repeat protein
VLLIYGQAGGFAFVNFDDDAHVTENENVITGLTAENLVWDFGIHGPSQWHPLTWMSHQLDCTLFDLDAGPHHVTNFGLHAAAAVLLYFACLRMTAAWGVSAFVAAAFAAHPLNVESVAWVSERRNVLCAVFWMLTLLAYDGYVRQPSWRRYGLVLLGHAAALMAKPLAVTLPCVLLLLDFWPLGRVGAVPAADPAEHGRSSTLSRLILEKLPLLALSAAASLLTVLCQQAVGTVATLASIPLSVRAANAVAAYGWYLQKTIWPSGLACFYPHPALVEKYVWLDLLAEVAVVGLFLAIFLYRAIRRRREEPWLLIGGLWFLGVMVPMIGLVQVGEQRQADRYAYLPLVGVFLAAASAGSFWARGSRQKVRFVGIAGCCCVAGWGLLAHRQTAVWRDSLTLSRHAIAATKENHFAQNNLGSALLLQGKAREAAPHFVAAIQFVPRYALAHYNLGIALYEQGRRDAALIEFAVAVELDASSSAAHQRLAASLVEAGRLNEALPHFRAATQLSPRDPQARFNLGLGLARAGQLDEAIESLREADRLQANHVPTALALASTLRAAGQVPAARLRLETLLRLNPDVPEAHQLLGEILEGAGEAESARAHFQEALRLKAG